jgi:hypothetical protein
VDISFEPLPLVIGVTGHRDLREEDIPLLKEKVAAVFDRLKSDFLNPHDSWLDWMRLGWVRRIMRGASDKQSGATPMIVLSSLAEGADQLVAEVAIDRGLRVIAPLPLPDEEYRRDFALTPVHSDAIKNFDAWMKPRSDVQTLFVGYEKGSSAQDVHDFGEKRNLQYRRAGVFIARHCDVLIALWDGKSGAGTGGTAEIIDFKLRGIPLDVSGSARASLDAPEIGPVIHIVTPRATKEETEKEVLVKSWGTDVIKSYEALDARRNRQSATRKEKQQIKLEMNTIEPDYLRWKSFEAPVVLSREFNREAAGLMASKKGRADLNQNLSWLFDARTDTELRDRAGAVTPRYYSLYAVADTLAQRWQRIFRGDWFRLFLFGLLAFVCFEAFSHLEPIAGHHHKPETRQLIDGMLLAGYLLAFAVVFFLYRIARRRQHQERFLDYRALAEALRVAVFWKLAGIQGAADSYPIKMPRELAWVKTCLLMQELHDAVDNAPSASLNGVRYEWIRRIWIEGQAGYFGKKRLDHLDDAEMRIGLSKNILKAAFGVVVVLLGLVLWSASWIGRNSEGHDLFLFAIGVMPGIAAVFVGHAEKLAFEAMARQYDRMAEVFGRAREVLPLTLAQADPDLVCKTLRELGTEAMRENAEWVSIYRQRPISLPQA